MIDNTASVNEAFNVAHHKALHYRHEFIMPEHLLAAFLEQTPFTDTLKECMSNIPELCESLENFLIHEVERIPDGIDYELELSEQFNLMISHAYVIMNYSEAPA